MKKAIYLAGMLFIFSCNTTTTEKTFVTEGSIKNTTAKMVYLEEIRPDAPPVIMDSFQLKPDGSFSLQAVSKEESLYQLRLQGMMVPFARFISDVPKLKLSGDMNNVTQPYTIEGSPASQSLIGFEKATYEQGQQAIAAQNMLDSLQKSGAADSVINAQYGKVESSVNGMKSYAQDFFSKSNSPVLTLYGLNSFQHVASNIGIGGFSQPEIAAIINGAAAKFPSHSSLQLIKAKFGGAETAPDFTQPDVNGKPVSLSSFKGKYVLVDFWASWCGPCRKENPNVVKAYNEFKDKNFTILGVSLDQNKDAWLKAIQQDGLTWTHVSDLNYWNNAAAVLYGVRSIPFNVLIDPQGKIVGRNLSGEEMAQTLRKLVP